MHAKSQKTVLGVLWLAWLVFTLAWMTLSVPAQTVDEYGRIQATWTEKSNIEHGGIAVYEIPRASDWAQTVPFDIPLGCEFVSMQNLVADAFIATASRSPTDATAGYVRCVTAVVNGITGDASGTVKVLGSPYEASLGTLIPGVTTWATPLPAAWGIGWASVGDPNGHTESGVSFYDVRAVDEVVVEVSATARLMIIIKADSR